MIETFPVVDFYRVACIYIELCIVYMYIYYGFATRVSFLMLEAVLLLLTLPDRLPNNDR